MTEIQTTSPEAGQELPVARQEQLEYLNHLRFSYTERSLLLDKLIVAIAAGAIAISLTLLDDVAAAVSKAAVWQLIWGWFFLGFTMFIVLISHRLSLQAHWKAIAYAQEQFAGEDISAPPPNNLDRAAGIGNILAIITLFVGLFLLFMFFSLCIHRIAPSTHTQQFVSDPAKYSINP